MKRNQASANDFWPGRLWLAGDTYCKRRTSEKEPGAVEYVRADHYDELLAWVERALPQPTQPKEPGNE